MKEACAKIMIIMMNTKIYKDNNYTVDIDFTPKPTLLNDLLLLKYKD